MNQRTTGPAGSMSMRDTLASSTYIRQAMSSGTSSAHAIAALIGLTWVTTTTVAAGRGFGHIRARRAHPAAQVLQRLAARRRERGIGSPARPHVLRHRRSATARRARRSRARSTARRSRRASERLGGDPARCNGLDDHEGRPWQLGGKPPRLLPPGVRERRVGAAQEAPPARSRPSRRDARAGAPTESTDRHEKCRPIRDQAGVSAPRPDPGGPQTESLGAGIFRRGHKSDDAQ